MTGRMLSGPCRRPAHSTVRGATLIESLIALLVLSLGLLGIAGLQAASLRYAQGGWARAGVATAMSSFAERVRSNPGASTTAYQLTTTYANQQAQVATLTESTACNTADCTPDALAASELRNWQVLLNNAMPGAAGFVTGDRSTGYQATIVWFDRTRTVKTNGTETLESAPACTGSETGIAARVCCPSAAAVPAGARCANFTVLP